MAGKAAVWGAASPKPDQMQLLTNHLTFQRKLQRVQRELVHVPYVGGCDLCVLASDRHVLMPEQVLQRIGVPPVLQEHQSKGMAQAVRVDPDADPLPYVADDILQAFPDKFPAILCAEQVLCIVGALHHPSPQRLFGSFADEHRAGLPTLCPVNLYLSHLNRQVIGEPVDAG
jgi:hypothetical protein